MECESKNGVIFDILFRLLVGMIRDLKMWCKVESPCYQGSGSCAPGIILVNFAGADEQWPLAMLSFWWECKDGVTPVVESGMIDSEFINVHEDNQFYGMMIEAMAGRRSFLVFIYWELESRQTRCLWSANDIENQWRCRHRFYAMVCWTWKYELWFIYWKRFTHFVLRQWTWNYWRKIWRWWCPWTGCWRPMVLEFESKNQKSIQFWRSTRDKQQRGAYWA